MHPLKGKLSRGKNVAAMTEFTITDGTALVYTPDGMEPITIYGPGSAGLS